MVMTNIAIENCHLVRFFPMKHGGSFHSYTVYVSLPEGNIN